LYPQLRRAVAQNELPLGDPSGGSESCVDVD
jgi:hypothetical protein